MVNTQVCIILSIVLKLVRESGADGEGKLVRGRKSAYNAKFERCNLAFIAQSAKCNGLRNLPLLPGPQAASHFQMQSKFIH